MVNSEGRTGAFRLAAARACLGMALFEVGAPLAWIVRASMHGGTSPVFTALLFVLSIALMVNLGAIRKGRLYASRAEIGVVLAPMLVLCALCFASVTPIGENPTGTSRGIYGPDTRQLIDNIVIIALIFAIGSQPVGVFRSVHRYVAIIGCIVAGGSLAYVLSSVGSILQVVARGRFGGFGTDDHLTTAKVGMLTIVAAWIWLRESDELKPIPSLVFLAAVGMSFPLFVLAGSRTNMLGAIAVVVAALGLGLVRRRFFPHPWRRRRRGVTRSMIALYAGVIAALSALIWFLAVSIGGLVNRAVSFLGTGTISFLASRGGGVRLDPSAADRRGALERALHYFDLWGNGFKSYFEDDPVMGAYYDLGIVGGTLFLLVTVVIPLKICVDLVLREKLPPFIAFSVTAYIAQLPYLFLSNTPYEAVNWHFVVLFYMVAGRYWGMNPSKRGSGERVFRLPVFRSATISGE